MYALCLIGKENNKEPERNIWCRALKIATIKKDLWLGTEVLFLVLIKHGDLNLTFRHVFVSTLKIKVEDSMYCSKMICEGKENEGS